MVIGYVPFDDGIRRLQDNNRYVSLWIGYANSEEELEEYLEEDYGPDTINEDDAVLNRFCLDFGFTYYDHDTLGYTFTEPTRNLADLISKAQDDYLSVIPKYVAMHGETLENPCNVAISLSYYRYIPDPTYVSPLKNKKVHLEFIGSVPYDEKGINFHMTYQ